MRILLTGNTGQVGWELERTLMPLGEVVAVGRKASPTQLDLANLASIRPVIQTVQPDLIVNAAAYTAVDQAETEPDLALRVNGTAPGVIAEEAKRLGIPLIHYSTDYVFDGQKQSPYIETDTPDPVNIYGHTKLAGEVAIQQVGGGFLIFRTSWVYGLRGKNFLMTMLKLAREREELRIVDDQIGAPTWSRAIAETTAQIVAQGVQDIREFCDQYRGLYHLSAGGQTSWYESPRHFWPLTLLPNSSECSGWYRLRQLSIRRLLNVRLILCWITVNSLKHFISDRVIG